MKDIPSLAHLVHAKEAGVWISSADGACIDVNARVEGLLELPRDALVSRRLFDFAETDGTAAQADASCATCSPTEITLRSRAGTARTIWIYTFPMQGAEAAAALNVSLLFEADLQRNLSDRGHAEPIAPDLRARIKIREPRLQHQLLREVHRAAKIGTWEAGSDEELLWSDETLALFGVDRTQFRGSIEEFFALVHPDDVERVKRVADFMGSEKATFKSEYRIIRPDGELRHMRQTAIVLRDAKGQPQGFSGVVQDVSEQVRTEAKLRQAQKMETIGQLSGGVAHDFNNILAAIMGAAELLQQEKTHDPELVDSIIKSAKRGGELTHRLLAFARKQPLRTTQVDVPKLIEDMAPMLDRLIGQDVRLVLELDPGAWPVEADPAPLEEALLNLTVNARDAIEGAGRITISCSNATGVKLPGDYVEIELADTGCGMQEAVRQQACDPFFTTKPVGKGSGLGLSMVDGYVRQSGGSMEITSSPSSGTRVSLFMPRAPMPSVQSQAPRPVPHPGKGETVLVIEDNKDLATLFTRQLASLNYKAVCATNREAALREANRANGFDIVLSEVLLADGERGPAVVEELLARFPKMIPVFMTGFASEGDEPFAAADPDTAVLRKPEPPLVCRRLLSSYFKLRFCLTSRLVRIVPPLRLA